MKNIGKLIVLSGFLTSGIASANQVLNCTTTESAQFMPFHWTELKVTLKDKAITVEVAKGNPQDQGQIADLAFVKMVHPDGVPTEQYHGKWRTPDMIGMKTLTIYLSSDTSTLTYIAGGEPSSWTCR